jgi:hypothetical protein
MGRQLSTTRPFIRRWPTHHPVGHGGGVADLPRGRFVVPPLPVGLGNTPYMGMDPSDPATWVRPWNPQPGMIARLNFDGARAQATTPMGGTWSIPAWQKTIAGGRPGSRPR